MTADAAMFEAERELRATLLLCNTPTGKSDDEIDYLSEQAAELEYEIASAEPRTAAGFAVQARLAVHDYLRDARGRELLPMRADEFTDADMGHGQRPEIAAILVQLLRMVERMGDAPMPGGA